MADKTLLSCRCTNCGAPIEIQPLQNIVKCEYCDTVFKVDKTNNEGIVINNVQNIKVEKKGFAQAAFEYLDKRAEAREKIEAEARIRQERAEAEARIRQARAEAEARARKAAADAQNRKFWYNVGQFLLWSCFFPIMVLVIMIKRANEMKENEQLMACGKPPKKLTPLPVALMIVGGFMFISAIGTNLKDNRLSYSSMSSDSFSPSITERPNTSSAGTDNTISSQTHWYEKETIYIKQKSFSEDVKTVDKKLGSIKYTIPADWRESEGNSRHIFFPIEGKNNTYITIYVGDLTNFDNERFEGYPEERVNLTILNDYYSMLIKQENCLNCSASPCVVNNIKGIFMEGNNVISDVKYDFMDTALIKGKTFLSVTALTPKVEDNVPLDDYVAFLNSIQVLEN